MLIGNVGVNPTRTGLLEILRHMGGRIDVRQDGRLVRGRARRSLARAARRAPLAGHSSCPPELVPLAIDEFPALFIAAACARRPNQRPLSGAEELRVKESDRPSPPTAAGLELPSALASDTAGWSSTPIVSRGLAPREPVFRGR